MVGLSLSGGGFRASLFHLGALRRLNELTLLCRLESVSSVSGGSILNGVLTVHWKELAATQSDGRLSGFDELVAGAVRAFCKKAKYPNQDLSKQLLTN